MVADRDSFASVPSLFDCDSYLVLLSSGVSVPEFAAVSIVEIMYWWQV